jgi:hypothetical protein
MSDEETIVIDTPEGISAWHMISQYCALRLDILGIKVNPAQHNRGLAKHIRETYKLDCGTSKQATLDAFNAYLRERGVFR